MKKTIIEFRNKKINELEKEVSAIRMEMAKEELSFKSSKPKDTNIIFKMKKKLAQILTVLTERKDLEKIEALKSLHNKKL